MWALGLHHLPNGALPQVELQMLNGTFVMMVGGAPRTRGVM